MRRFPVAFLLKHTSQCTSEGVFQGSDAADTGILKMSAEGCQVGRLRNRQPSLQLTENSAKARLISLVSGAVPREMNHRGASCELAIQTDQTVQIVRPDQGKG